MDDVEEDFKQLTGRLDKDQLLFLADAALCAMEGVLDGMHESESGDYYEYNGSMKDVECARETISRYRGYLITGQK
jgi:hypothetical protein